MPQKPQTGRSKKTAGEKVAKKTQRERFIKAARDVGVDESGKEFERAIKRLFPKKTGSGK